MIPNIVVTTEQCLFEVAKLNMTQNSAGFAMNGVKRILLS